MAVDRRSNELTPQWLDDGQLAIWKQLMSLFARLPAALECQLQQDSQLRFLEYYVLAVLSDQPENRMRMSELATHTHAELSRLSHLAARLQARGLLDRQPDPRDGRFTLAILTNAGLGHLSDAAPGHVARVRELVVDALTPGELTVLSQILSTLNSRLAQDDCKPTEDG